MKSSASFQQILEEKIQALHRESRHPQGFEANTSSQDPTHLAYLIGHVGSTFFRPSASKAYPSRPKPPPPPHPLTTAQIWARDYFVLQGVELSPAFSLRELKRAFRTLAFKHHPDMNKGASGAFIELKNNYETLLQLFS